MEIVQKIANQILVNPKGITYNEERNMFLTTGYTSGAGNTYLSGLRLSDKLSIKTSIGIGWLHMFLNGVYVYVSSEEGDKHLLIGTKSYYNTKYSENIVKETAKAIVKEKLLKKSLELNVVFEEDSMNALVDELVEEAYKPQLDIAAKNQGLKMLRA